MNKSILLRPLTRGPENHFFGYYDKCPWDRKGNRILAHRTSFIDRFPNHNDQAEIGYISSNDRNEFVRIADTTAWNWQQGAQLQWLPKRLSDTEQIIFNDRKEGQLVAVILDPTTGDKRIIDTPIYTVSPSGRHALSLNYARLFETRMDYGIAGLDDRWRDVMCPENDGVYSVDLQTGMTELIVSIAQGAAVNHCPLGEGAKHWVNHMMFNPSGRRFCFLHRFLRDDGIMHSRLLTADSDGSDLRLLFEGMVSHYCWKDDTTILAWAGKRKILGDGKRKSNLLMTSARRCFKPIYYAMGKPRILMQKVVGDSFYLIQDAPNGTVERFAYGRLSTDGHCTLSPDGRWMLTDGYTDKKNRLPLFLYDVSTQEVVEIGRFPTPKILDGPVRVDLHPRFNRDGTKVCIDSAMDGTRQMYVIDISEIVGSV
jgi:hypothetical protein